MKILFLVLGNEYVASSRTRVLQFLPHLAREGVQTRVIKYKTGLDYVLLARWSSRDPFSRFFRALTLKIIFLFHRLYSPLQMLRFLLAAPHYDVLFVQKVLMPLGIQKRAFRKTPRVVFDFDDAIYAEGSTYDRRRLENQLSLTKLACLENDDNAAYVKRFGVDSVKITGPIDCDRYRPRTNARPSNDVVIGWVGSLLTTPYLRQIEKTLLLLSQRHKNVRFDFVGADYFDLPGARVERHGWSLDGEVGLLQQFDIGIMPLPDNVDTRGKGGYKLLQYMAVGIPSVASPIAVNKEIIISEETGFLATSDDEWLSVLDRLITDAGLRARIGGAARKRAEDVYSYEASTPRLLKALRGLAS